MAFGDVWKESLTELSGGQRSLLALSLILAMLLFKPAPIYILDEVSHLQPPICISSAASQLLGPVVHGHSMTTSLTWLTEESVLKPRSIPVMLHPQPRRR